MPSFIKLGRCSRFYLYILCSVIFKFLESISLGYKNNNGDNKFSLYKFIPILYESNYMKSIYTYLGYIIFGTIFFLIFSRCQNIKASKQNLVPKGIIHNKTSKKSKKTYFQIFLFCFFFVFHCEIKKILYILNFQPFNIWTFDIFFMLFFLNKYFIVTYFRHQKCSIYFIISTSAVMLLMSSILPFSKEDGEYINSYKVAKQKGSYFYSIPLFIFFIFLSFIYSFSRITGKILMQIKFISPYILIILLGITGLIFTIIAALISTKLDYSDNIFKYFEKLGEKKNEEKYEFYFEIFFVTPIYSFIMFMEIVFELLTVYYLNPLFILINNNLCYGVIQLITFIEEYSEEYGLPIIFQFLCEELAEVFALLGYSVYLEIIELRFCGLDSDLRIRISNRADIELRQTLGSKDYINGEQDDDSEGEEDEKENDSKNYEND